MTFEVNLASGLRRTETNDQGTLMNGFLGTGATFRADMNLVVQLSMGFALLAGMFLAKRKKFRAHKYCQSSVMLLNLVMIFLIMAPSFHRQVQPQVPGGLREAYYWVPYTHAMLGSIAEVLGIYIVLVAATQLLPRRLRFKRYKPWMRTELALWWIVVLIGVSTYSIWYVGSTSKAASGHAAAPVQSAAAADRASVKISNFQFEPKELTVKTGTIVEWTDERGKHTVEADDGSFKSDTLTAAGTFEHKFDSPGVYPYFCSFHGDKHGKDMSGVITVTP
jgi:plastocyanin/fumarate reductase subunit D